MRYRTLDKNWQFNRVYGRGKSYVHPHCVLYVAKNRLGYTRIGLTATKKVGHAVQRNRARRVMRAALSEHLAQNIGGYDIILVARGQTPRPCVSSLASPARANHAPSSNCPSPDAPEATGWWILAFCPTRNPC